MNEDFNPDTEREQDVGPPVPKEPPMINLVTVFKKIKDFFGSSENE